VQIEGLVEPPSCRNLNFISPWVTAIMPSAAVFQPERGARGSGLLRPGGGDSPADRPLRWRKSPPHCRLAFGGPGARLETQGEG